MANPGAAPLVAERTGTMINALHPGDQLDHYRIDTLVKCSGMSTIFRGTNLLTGCSVAIKIPHFEMECDPVFFDRFRREAEIGRKLNHPGVVKVLNNDDPSRVYMAMEWVEGRPLRELLDEQKQIPFDRARRIVLSICEALEYIHGHGVVHRDLKPDNIMVDAEDHIKLIDFGIARDTAARRLTFGKLTKTMGTPDYISPEQVRGKRGDEQSDIYSLGVMLYEMLAGDVPFRASHPLAAMNQRLLNDPEPPSESNPQISPRMQQIILRALEREPHRRYVGARQFANDLKNPDRLVKDARPSPNVAGQEPMPGKKIVLSWVVLLMIPVIIFVLLLLVSRQH